MLKQFNQEIAINDIGKANFVTKSTATKEDAIEAKMAQIEPRIAGIRMIKYERGNMRKVWVPYYFLEYNYEVVRNVFFNKNQAFNKRGIVAVVYDANEMHASHYDLITEGEMLMLKKDLSGLGGTVLEDAGSREEIYENAERSIQRQILFKAYKMEGKLAFKSSKKFYREAWELQVFYKDRKFIKYAYLDDYGTQNERVRGLKIRMDN